MSAAQANPAPGHSQPVPIHPGERAEPVVAAVPQRAPVRDKRVLRRVLMLGGVLVVGVVTGATCLRGGRCVGAADGYVKAAQLRVTTDVSGIVQSVEVHEGQRVAAGDVLFRLDAEPFEIALANAKAALLQGEMTVRSLKADYRSAMQQVQAQQALVDV